MSKCPNCGGELDFDVKAKNVVCPYCGTNFNPKELKTQTKHAKETESFEGKSYNCASCGAQILVFDDTAVTFCSYCGSQSMIESKMVKVNNPDYVIPFMKTKEECIAEYKKMLRKALFVPKYMKEDLAIQKFRGIFMPYGIYKTSLHGKCSNHGEKYSHRSGDYVYYDEYDITAQVDADYDGISYDLISKYYDNYSTSIPFDYNGIEEFNKNYLTGFYADSKDVDASVYNSYAEDISTADTSNHLSKRREFRKYGCKSPKAKMHVHDIKTGMFPVYFLGVKDKQNKMHYAVINGQTGKVAADLPIDFAKFIIGTIILSVLVFALLYFAAVILPKTVLSFSMIGAIISIIISINQQKKIYNREYHFDDVGFMHKNVEKIEKEEQIQVVAKKEKRGKSVLLGMLMIWGGMVFGLPLLASILFTLLPEGPLTILLFTVGIVFLIVGTVKSMNGGSKSSKNQVDIYKDGKKVKKYKFKDISKQVIALIAGALVLVSGTIRDEIYYGAAIVIFVLIILSFKDLIDEHNILTSNKPPQLEKRGGDEIGK